MLSRIKRTGSNSQTSYSLHSSGPRENKVLAYSISLRARFEYSTPKCSQDIRNYRSLILSEHSGFSPECRVLDGPPYSETRSEPTKLAVLASKRVETLQPPEPPRFAGSSQDFQGYSWYTNTLTPDRSIVQAMVALRTDGRQHGDPLAK